MVAALVASMISVAGGVGLADPSEGVGAPALDVQRRVTVGALHTCALLDTGEVQCWGSNEFGQLGNGTKAASTTPRKVTGITTALAIAAGATHTCALVHDGTVWCWGSNGSGQLGDGSTTDALTPVQVDGLDNAISVGVGAFHSCAVRDDGSVVCWGHDGAGQLGDGGGLGTALQPVSVLGITTAEPAVAVTGGEFFTCALMADGTVRCWGHNGFGQLGDGTTDSTSTPVVVSGITDTAPATALAAGYGHVCATRHDDSISCWGGNEFGQLGDDTQTARSTPVTVHDIGGSVTAAPVAISAGQFHTCALLADGSARCWGENGRGQLGDPLAAETFEKTPREVFGLVGAAGLSSGGFHNCAIVGSGLECWGYNFYGQLGSYLDEKIVPETVTAVQGATTVTSGNGHACSIVELASVECWGNNSDGQLGAATPEALSTIPVTVAGLAPTAQLAAGNRHTCALPSSSGSPLCWGRNLNGQLGDGTTTPSTTPVTVSGLTTATSISAEGAMGTDDRGHTCAPREDATAACWGRNANGQLGNDSTTDSPVPVIVLEEQEPDPDVTLAGVSEVVAGGFHSCAIVTGGEVRCWGFNGDGQLGDDTNDQRLSAVTVLQFVPPPPPPPPPDPPPPPPPPVPLTGATQLALGAHHTCALVPPQVYCWGRNSSGQLGDGTTSDSDLAVIVEPMVGPPPFGTNETPVAITAGDLHTCALSATNLTFCWGENGDGQIGDGTKTDRPVPTHIVGLQPPPSDPITERLSGGRSHTCAAMVDTTVRCWGDNAFGQIGDGVGPESTAIVAVLGLAAGINGNAIPSPVDDSATTPAGVAVTIDVLANDSDPDGDPLSITGVEDPDKGSAAVVVGGISYTPDPDFCTVDQSDRTDTFSYTVSDGTATVPADVTVTVDCPNDAPDAVDDVAVTGEDTPVTIDVLANDSDPNGDPITLDTVSDPAGGSATIVAGEVSYTPDADFCGTDPFTYTISDDAAAEATGSVTVTVSCENDAPVAGADAASTDEDSAVTVDVLGNDSDADGDALTVATATPGAHGTTVVDGGATITYTPAPGFCGTDAFTYRVSDGVLTDEGSVSVTVACVNDGPNAVDDSATTAEDTAVDVDVLANDTDPDGDSLTIVSVTAPGHGTAVIATGKITYTPAPDFCGADTFGYTIEDANGETDSAVVVPVTVTCHQDPPVATDDVTTTDEDTTVAIDVLANDTDPDLEPLAVAAVTDPPHGSATIASSGEVHYTPDVDHCGTDTFDYTLTDNHGGTDSGQVDVTIACVNDAPVLAPVADRTVAWGDELSVGLSASDVDGDPLVFALVAGPAGMSVSPAGTVTWTPLEGQVGAHQATVSVSDGSLSAQRNFAVTVEPRDLAIAYDGVTEGQYSDPVHLAVELTDAVNGTPVAGREVTFVIGSRSAPATTDAAGRASATLELADTPGATAVEVTFPGDPGYAPQSSSTPFTIAPEAITVRHVGDHVTLTDAAWAPVRFSAELAEEADGSLASIISTVDVVFTDVDGQVLCRADATQTSVGNGVASCWGAYTEPVGSQAVIASVDAAAYAGPVDVGAFVVASAVKGSVLGAGSVLDPDETGRRDDFAFQAVPVRRSPPAGSAVHVFDDVADLGTGSTAYAFVVDSTALTGLTLGCSGGKTKVCATTVEGDASVWAVELDTGAVQAVAGAATVRIDATDAAAPSAGTVPPDRYAVDVGGAVTRALASSGAQLLIERGDVRVIP